MSKATEWLKEEIAAKMTSSFNNGCADCGVASNDLQICLDEIEHLQAAFQARSETVNRQEFEVKRLRDVLRDMVDLAQSMDGFGYCDEEEYEESIKMAKEVLGDD